MAVLIIAIFTYQFIVIRNLKNELHDSTLTISTLKQNENAIRDSLNFKADSVAVLHSRIANKEKLNKELSDMYDNIKEKSNNDIKQLKNSIGLLKGEIKFKDQTIANFQQNVSNISVVDSIITIPINYNNTDMGLTLDGKAVGNFVNKQGYVHWNKIETKLPKLKIGLVYNEADSTIVAMVEASDKMETFSTTISEELYRLLIDNVLPQETWKDRFGIVTEIEHSNSPFVTMQVYGCYRNFYGSVGKKFDIFDKFSGENVYRVGYKMSLNKMMGMIK